MIAKRVLLSTIALFVLGGGEGVLAQGPLIGYMTEAAGNNPGVRAKFEEYRAALEAVPQVGTLSDPEVAFGYFLEPIETRVGPQTARISASQKFPWFGTLKARKDAASAAAQAKLQEALETRSRLQFDVAATYYDLYAVGKALSISGEILDLLRTFRSLALIKVESGVASSVDVLRVEMEIAEIADQVAHLEDTFGAMIIAFNYLLNVEEDRTVKLPDTLHIIPSSLTREQMLDSIINNNHQVLGLEYAAASHEKKKLAARRSGMPGFKIGIDYVAVGKSSNPMVASSESGRDAIVFPMVGISIPLYRRKYTAMVAEAARMVEANANARQDRVNTLHSAFAKTEKEFRDAERRITLNSEQARRAKNALAVLRSGYEADGEDFVELLRMERQFLTYRIELEKARAEKGASVAFLNYLMGI